jgi:hypothetical protein
MNIIQRLEHWGDTHHPKWLDIIRIFLGMFLFLKGLDFINNMDVLGEYDGTRASSWVLWAGLLAHFVVFAHL